MDIDAYHQWNPFIQSINGTIAPNHKITVLLQLEGKKAQVFKPRIQVLKPNQRVPLARSSMDAWTI